MSCEPWRAARSGRRLRSFPARLSDVYVWSRAGFLASDCRGGWWQFASIVTWLGCSDEPQGEWLRRPNRGGQSKLRRGRRRGDRSKPEVAPVRSGSCRHHGACCCDPRDHRGCRRGWRCRRGDPVGRSRPRRGLACRDGRADRAHARDTSDRTQLHRRDDTPRQSQCELCCAPPIRWTRGADLAIRRYCGG
ncbi:hypothetical protein chiPu_0030908, partial [Chiloscyllium punctatum]|nr:hypothetical protein [Chiloscyllium punctatum]